MDKRYIRKEFKKIRKNVQDKKLKSNIITEKLLDLDEVKNANVVAIYASLADEVNTDILIEKLLILNKIVAIPKLIDDEKMEFYRINNISDLVNKNLLGILEPESEEFLKVNKEEIELMIIPGICFDMNKNRVGFGKGYYDKYLENNDINKIGICFDEQILVCDRIDADKNDVKMDRIITNAREI